VCVDPGERVRLAGAVPFDLKAALRAVANRDAESHRRTAKTGEP